MIFSGGGKVGAQGYVHRTMEAWGRWERVPLPPISGWDFWGLVTLWPHSCSRPPTPSWLPGPKPVTGVGLGLGYSSEGFFIPWVLSTRDSSLSYFICLYCLAYIYFHLAFWDPVTVFCGKSAAWKEQTFSVYSLHLPSFFLLLLLYG